MKFTIKENWRPVSDYTKTLNSNDTFSVEIKPYRSTRSLEQNRLYWMWLSCIQEETGQIRDDIHVYLKQEFISFEYKPIFGKQVSVYKSTKELNTKEFTVYLDTVKKWAYDFHDIDLPEPHEKRYGEFEERYGR